MRSTWRRDARARLGRWQLSLGERTICSVASVPTFWSDQYDIKIKSAGLLSVADRWVVVEDALESENPALVVERIATRS